MKRILYIAFLTIISLAVSAVNDTIKEAIISDIADTTSPIDATGETKYKEAIVAYGEGDYYKAIDILKVEINTNKKEGLESPSLYYNLGNAYFRVNELGHARLNYERAALLDPSDRDIRHNIEYTTTRIEDKILEVDQVFLSTWFNNLQNLFAPDSWSTIGIVFFLSLIACLIAFFFTQKIAIKQGAFYIGLITIAFCILSNMFAYRQKVNGSKRDKAIIMAPSVSVVSSPDSNGKEVFRLHVGTKVSVTKDDRHWLEIEIDNGSVGWIQRDKLEII